MLGLFQKKATFPQIHFAADHHCHLLPGVDDGVKSLQDTVSILEAMRDQGIKSVTFTPHMQSEIFPDNTEDHIRQKYEQCIKELPEELLSSIDISLAGEYMVCPDFDSRDPKNLLQFEKGSVLIEMSYLYESRNIEQALFNIGMNGIHPVIAHPERYLYLSNNLSRFERFHDMGASFQLNLLSLGGAYGRPSIRILNYILENGWYTHIGSDTHSIAHFDNIVNMHFPASYLDMLSTLK